MTINYTDVTAHDMLNSLYTGLGGASGGFLYIFGYTSLGGAIPASSGIALSAMTGAVAIAKIGAGTGGPPATSIAACHFIAPTAGITTLTKVISENWGTVPANNAAGTNYATWFRYCTGADTGQSADTAGSSSASYRVQGTIGLAGSGADLILPSLAITTSTDIPIGTFFLNLPQAATV